METLAKVLWHAPVWIKWLIALDGWVPVKDAWVDAPHSYRMTRWDEDRLYAHNGSWRHRWVTLTRKHAT